MLPSHLSLSQPATRSASGTIHDGLVAFCLFAVCLYHRKMVTQAAIQYLSVMSSVLQRIYTYADYVPPR